MGTGRAVSWAGQPVCFATFVIEIISMPACSHKIEPKVKYHLKALP